MEFATFSFSCLRLARGTYRAIDLAVDGLSNLDIHDPWVFAVRLAEQVEGVRDTLRMFEAEEAIYRPLIRQHCYSDATKMVEVDGKIWLTGHEAAIDVGSRLLDGFDSIFGSWFEDERPTTLGIAKQICAHRGAIVRACTGFLSIEVAQRIVGVVQAEQAMLTNFLSGSDVQHKTDSIHRHRFEFAEKFKREFEVQHGRPFNPGADSAAMRVAYNEQHPGRKPIKQRDFQNARRWAKEVGLTAKGDE